MRTMDWALVSAGVCLGLAAMAVDHLLGDDPGLEDPPTFLISAAIILVIATLLFALVVRRGARDPRRASFIVAVLSVLSLPLIWLGVPFAVAPAAMALGLRGEGRLAIAAITTGILVLLLVTGAYVYSAVDKLA
jgi:hypothetical protein